MKRPYIPIKVRLKVAERQAAARDMVWFLCYLPFAGGSQSKKLQTLLRFLFPPDGKCELDHDPALILRRRTRSGKYKPDANDPEHLVYRSRDNHKKKTVGRSPGAERTITSKGSDIWLTRKFKKLEEGKPKRQKRKISSRSFPRRATAWKGGLR